MSRLPVLAAIAVAAAAPSSRTLYATTVAVAQAASQLDTTYGCVACHADKRTAFVQGVHAERGIRCHDCHGGDPNAFALPAAHRGRFIGAPDKVATVALCGSCHSDPNRMRQYGLPSGQVAEFRTSQHGRLLLVGHDLDAPTCTDCHDAHTILRPDDARSTVYPTNIPATCARCHEDKVLMAKYKLPTDQVERYRQSAHGVALFRNQNFASPTCVG
ncbi:MAG TPA: cytochrome c3 family protein, partial [Gemmatimonadales bacterium]